MQLQEQLLAQLQGLIQFGSKISSQSNITQTGQYALDAREKNANIRDTLAWLINQVNSDLQVERLRINTFTSLPAGSTTGDAELMDIRVGIDGSTYPSAGDAVRRQIENYRDVVIGDHAPTEKSVKVWVDTSKKTGAEYFWVPEVRDDRKNSMDTWSSDKIDAAIRLATRDVVVSDTRPAPSDTKVWIDTSKKASADMVSLPEIRDDVSNSVEDTWSSSKIRHEIDLAGSDIFVGASRPTGAKSDVKVWIDTSKKTEADTFMLPEVRDDMTNTYDTWSSSKIRHEINLASRDIYIGVSSADAVASNAKIWIDTNPHNTFMLPEIDDEVVSRIDTWSSQKIAGELSKIRRELGLEA